MCMEDIRIGRESVGACDNKQFEAGVDTPMVGANEWRTSLTVSIGGEGTALIRPTGATGTEGGFLLNANQGRFVFTLENCGRLLQKPFNILAIGDIAQITWIEVTLEKR